MLEPGRKATDPLPMLAGWIKKQVASQNAAEADPRQRLSELLSLIDRSLPDPAADRRDAAHEQCDLALSVLGREHRLALAQAHSLFRKECSRLRSNLKPVLQAAAERSPGSEGLTTAVRGLRKVIEHAAETYLSTLRAAFEKDGPPALRSAGEAINTAAALEMRRPASATPALPLLSHRDWRASGLEAAAVAVAVVMHSWISIVGGGLALVAVNNWRQAKRRRKEAAVRMDAEEALHGWLTDIEPKLIEEFDAAAEKVVDEIRQQVVRRFHAEESEQAKNSTEGAEIRRVIAHCRSFLDAEKH
jgi:hypothetical protein